MGERRRGAWKLSIPLTKEGESIAQCDASSTGCQWSPCTHLRVLEPRLLRIRRRPEIDSVCRDKFFSVCRKDGIVIFPLLRCDELHALRDTDHHFIREERPDGACDSAVFFGGNLFVSQKESNVTNYCSLQIAILHTGKLHDRNTCTLVR